jgi:hypothetical protein
VAISILSCCFSFSIGGKTYSKGRKNRRPLQFFILNLQ